MTCMVAFEQLASPVTGFRAFDCAGSLPLVPFVEPTTFAIGGVVKRRVVALGAAMRPRGP